MERAAEEAAHGALGLAGICHETLRMIHSLDYHVLLGMVITISLSLLAHVAVCRTLFSDAVANTSGAGVDHLAANWAPFFLAEAAFLGFIVLHSIVSGAFCVFAVAARYSSFAADVGRDARSITRDLRQVPTYFREVLVYVLAGNSRLAARLVRTGHSIVERVIVTSCVALLLLLGYTAILAAVAVFTHLPRPALLLVYLAGAAHIGVVWRVACVVSVLEDRARGFRAIKRSNDLLASAGMFRASAAVFTALDSCAVAVQLAFLALVVDNRMGLSVLVRVTAGVAMAAVLWAAVSAGLVAQVVVYFVCNRRRRESCEDLRRSRPVRAAQHTATA